MKREDTIYVRIEPPFKEALDRLADKEDKSTSTLVREIIIDCLNERGLLPEHLTLALLKA